MRSINRFGLLFFIVALHLTGCADGLFEPARPTTPSAPIAAPAPPSLPEYRGPSTRSFLMGFTRWPADLTREGMTLAENYAYAHSDIVSVTFIGGIPWAEALDNKTYPADVQENLKYRPPAGKKLFLSISPLDKDRRGLAPYWGETDNQPLPPPWNREALNSPRVKRAYVNFVLRAVEAMRPDFLAIGVEANMLLSRNPERWRQYKELHSETYRAIKKLHKGLPVFFTTDVIHYKRLVRDAKGSEQEKEVMDLMRFSDLFAMTVYPHMSLEVPRPVPANFLDFATRFKRPVAVAESGMSSQDVDMRSYSTLLRGSDTDQYQFTELLLKTAARDYYEFVINFASTDSDRLVARLQPPLDDLARIWAYTGMQTSDQRPKPASAVWDGYLRAKYEQVKWW
ncbi:MAG TPA: glycosyl hydrolase 53 family protein [Candidatus Binatia bacterium]|nr:glycosyl hydrolase 53 family protein [Candidatus Binatia bacterium]